MTQTTPDATAPVGRLDPEDAQLALATVQEVLHRHALVENLVHRQEQNDSRSDLVEGLLHRQHEAELSALVNSLHPADIAFILESLPSDDRLLIWRLVGSEHDADVLLEVADWVRESLIEAMDRQDLVAATGNMDVITAEHMMAMRPNAIVCNIGHFDSEIQISALSNYKWTEVKPGTDIVEFPDGNQIIVLAKGRLVNLGCATGHPSFVMSASFTNQVLAQIELWTKSEAYENRVYVLPKHLDEKVARLHLDKLGVKLTTLSDKQAAYIGVGEAGPFKPDHYRY
jgi:hypothetical protein